MYETTCATNLIMSYEAFALSVTQYTSCVFAPSLYRDYQFFDIMQNVYNLCASFLKGKNKIGCQLGSFFIRSSFKFWSSDITAKGMFISIEVSLVPRAWVLEVYLALKLILYLACDRVIKQVVDPAIKENITTCKVKSINSQKILQCMCHKPCSTMKLHRQVAHIKGAAISRQCAMTLCIYPHLHTDIQ